MKVNFNEIEAAVKGVRSEFGLTKSYLISLELWYFDAGNRELAFKIAVFDNADKCVQHHDHDWHVALENVRLELAGKNVTGPGDPGGEPIIAEVADDAQGG